MKKEPWINGKLKNMDFKNKNDMNMIISGLQNNTKEWSHILNDLQNQIPNMTTPNIIYKP